MNVRALLRRKAGYCLTTLAATAYITGAVLGCKKVQPSTTSASPTPTPTPTATVTPTATPTATPAAAAVGDIHFALFDGAGSLYHYSNASGSWTATLVDSPAAGGEGGLSLDASDAVHLTYFKSPENWYATNASGTWATSLITNNSLNTYYNAVANSSTNEARLAYSGEISYSMYHRVRSGGSWGAASNLRTGVWTMPFMYFSISIDESDASHVLATRPVGGGNLNQTAVFSLATGTAVEVESCSSGIVTGGTASTSNNDAHIVYLCHNGGGWTVRYGHAATPGTSFSLSTLNSAAAAARPSLTVDRGDNVHVVYSTTGGDLLYRVKPNGGSWTSEVTAVAAGAGYTVYPQVAADGNDDPHIVYARVSGGSGTIYYTEATSGSFSTPEAVVGSVSNPSLLRGIGITGEEGVSNH